MSEEMAALLTELIRVKRQRDMLLEALKAAVECGMVPLSSASDGDASKHSIQVQVADQIRAAIAAVEGEKNG